MDISLATLFLRHLLLPRLRLLKHSKLADGVSLWLRLGIGLEVGLLSCLPFKQ